MMISGGETMAHIGSVTVSDFARALEERGLEVSLDVDLFIQLLHDRQHRAECACGALSPYGANYCCMCGSSFAPTPAEEA